MESVFGWHHLRPAAHAGRVVPDSLELSRQSRESCSRARLMDIFGGIQVLMERFCGTMTRHTITRPSTASRGVGARSALPVRLLLTAHSTPFPDTISSVGRLETCYLRLQWMADRNIAATTGWQNREVLVVRISA